jgi:arylsulfotransferase ASST
VPVGRSERVAAAALLLCLGTVTLVAAACGTGEGRRSAKEARYRTFFSRPDLRPPRVVVKTAARGSESGYIFLAPKEGGRGGPLIVDDTGEPVWFHPLEAGEATDFRVQRYRGRPVLTWWEGIEPTVGIGSGRFVIADSSYRRIAVVGAGRGLEADLHEFVITPRDTALLLAYERVPYDLSSLGGPKDGYVFDSVVQEVEIESGRVLFEWRSLDHVAVAESAQRIPAREASAAKPFDYFHVNSVNLDTDGNLLVSARNTNAIYKLSRRTGRVIWRLGGRNGDFEMGPGTRFAWQHDARRLADGTISLFDNSAIPKVADHSRAVVLSLDERARAASLVRAYVHPLGLLSPHQGNAQPLSSGGFFVGWGGKPYFTEFSRSGRVLLDGRLAAGDSYRAYRFSWRGRPVEPPAVAARLASDGTMSVHASWNGATDVARWKVLTGRDPDELRPVVAVPREGFETTVTVETAPYVAVRALAATGSTLATSDVVRASR